MIIYNVFQVRLASLEPIADDSPDFLDEKEHWKWTVSTRMHIRIHTCTHVYSHCQIAHVFAFTQLG